MNNFGSFVITENSEHEETYRVSDDGSSCIFLGCFNEPLSHPPDFQRANVLLSKKLYISPSSLVCDYHLTLQCWNLLREGPLVQDFNQEHVEDIVDLFKQVVFFMNYCTCSILQ